MADTPTDRTLLHLAVRAEWDAQAGTGAYAPAAFAAEGFVHCSYDDQIAGVYGRYYAGRDDLVVLVIDRATLIERVGAAAVVDEALTASGEAFPHVYARVPHAAAREVRELRDVRALDAVRR